MAWWWIPAIIAAVFVVRLTWSAISNWFAENKRIDSSYGEVIKQYLSNGNYQVVTHVFNKYGTKTASRVWDTDELSDDLNSRFRSRNRIRIDLN